MKILHKPKSYFQSTLSLVALLLSVLLFVLLLPSRAHAETPVDRLVEAAKSGAITQSEFADSLLSLAEVNQLAIERPEILVLRFPGFIDIVGAKAVARVVEHVKQDNADSIAQLSIFIERMLGSQSSYTNEIRRLVELRSKYEELVSRGTVDTASAFRAELRTDLERQIFSEKLESFMNRRISELTQRDAPFSGIRNLMQLGKVSQPPALIAAVKELLQILLQQAQQKQLNWQESNFHEAQIEKFLADLRAKDPELTPLLLALEEARIFHHVALAEYAAAQEALADVLLLRSDPSEANLALRKRILFSLNGEQAAPFAQELITPLAKAGELSLREKLRLYWAGYYGQGTVATIVVGMFGLLLLAVLLLLALGRMIPDLSPDHLYARWQESRRKRLIRKNEKRGVGYTSAIEHEDQYSLLLKEFGLDDDASEADIKKAYRQLVKELHPDAHGASGRVVDAAGNTDRSFEDLKRNYNRLMEMRNSFFSK